MTMTMTSTSTTTTPTPTLTSTSTAMTDHPDRSDDGLSIYPKRPMPLDDQYQLLIQQRQIMTLYDYYLYQRNSHSHSQSHSHSSSHGPSIATTSN